MVDPITVTATKALMSTTLIDTIRDGMINWILERGKDLIKDEFKGKIASLRSDHKLRQQIATAVQDAADHWEKSTADKELARAVNQSTSFADLDSVKQAMRQLGLRPFDPIAATTLRGKFAEVLPSSFEPERIERGVKEYLNILRDELIAIPAVQQTQAAFAQLQTERHTAVIAELQLQTEHNTAVIAELLEKLLSPLLPSEQTLYDYLTYVINRHRYLDPRGTQQTVRQVQVLLEDVYVSLEAEAEPKLSAIDRPFYEQDLQAFMVGTDLSAVETEDLRENLLTKYTERQVQPERKPVELAELVREYPKLVILGGPGAGKTTLMRYLALIHAQSLRKGEREITDYGPTRLPLYLRIADYAEHGNGQSLDDFLPRALCGERYHDSTLETLVRERLKAGTCLVLLDGLDEVIEPSLRAKIAGQINLFVRTHENTSNRFVITSRVAGYRSAPLGGEMIHMHVRDMNDEQIHRFLHQWCYAVERFQTPDLSSEAQAQKAEAEIAGITAAIHNNPGVRRLAANPLLLRTLALIHRTGARLPQRRIELYRLTADTLIRDWELARGIPADALVSEAEATRLLSELADWMHRNKPAGIATEWEVRYRLAELKAGMAGKEADDPAILQAVDDFLSKIRQHTGLFVERAPQRYGFMHLTFEEYFAARWLVARPKQAAQRIRERLHLPRWEEPILLAVAFYGMEFPDDVDDLFEEALLGKELGGPSPYEHRLHRDLLFAVRVLGDQDTSPTLRRRLVGDFVKFWLNPQDGRKFSLLSNRCIKTLQTLRDSAAYSDAIAALLVELKKNLVNDVRAGAAWALRNATDNSDVVNALLSALTDDSAGDVRARVALALGDAINRPDVVKALLDALHNDRQEENVRANVALALGNATDRSDVVKALLDALHNDCQEENVRTNVALALGNTIDRSDVVKALLDALSNDRHPNVRARIASVLSRVIDRSDVIDALKIASRDDRSDYVRATATSVLGHVGDLLNILDKPYAYDRARAASDLGGAVNYPGVFERLLKALQDPEENVRAGAHWALRNAPYGPNDVTVLLANLQDSAVNTRARAAWALRDAADSSDVVQGLLVALKDRGEANVRAGAAWSLRNATNRSDVVERLLVALKDPAENVRLSATLALHKAAGSGGVVTALLAALRNNHEGNNVRASAALALGNATNSFNAVTAALFDALRDPAEDVRADAALALYALASQLQLPPTPDFAKRLADSLDLPGLDEYSIHANSHPINSLFNALAAAAPTPGQARSPAQETGSKRAVRGNAKRRKRGQSAQRVG
jgi:HEAT repeat protein